MAKANQLKIYLIITERIITQTLQEFLTKLEYEVYQLNSIHDLSKIFQNDSDCNALVLSEEGCFRGSEQSIFRKIHQQYPNILFVVIIENQPFFSIKEALAHGIYGYLHRPISLTELELLLVRLKEKK